ncbi:MAG: type II secretion system F family protein [Synergistetes bacterium]|nr:type II secretion system F family protein [Synergistota bacterium]
MPLYFYRAKSFKGEIVEGRRETEDEKTLYYKLREEGLFPIYIKEEKRASSDVTKRKTFVSRRVSIRDIAILSRQLSTMIKAGMTVVAALDILSQQTANRNLRMALRFIKRDVEEGSSLAEAMSKHEELFDELYVNLIKAGEAGGVLDEVLERLASHLERESALTMRIKTAMRYPVFVLSLAIIIIFMLVTFIVPRFVSILESIGVPLPAPTRILMSFTHWLEFNYYKLLLIPLFLWILVKLLKRHEKTSFFIDNIKLKLPIIGKLTYKVAMVRFSRTLAVLSAAAVPVLDSIEMVSKVVGNKVISKAVASAKDRVQEGQSLAESILVTGIFPPMLTHMMAVGEETGNLDEMLHKVADFYDEEIDNDIKGISSLIEPVLVVFIGLVVGFIAISVFMPLFQLIGGLSR